MRHSAYDAREGVLYLLAGLRAAAAGELLAEEFAGAAVLVAAIEALAVVHQPEHRGAEDGDDDETGADRADRADHDDHENEGDHRERTGRDPHEGEVEPGRQCPHQPPHHNVRVLLIRREYTFLG